MASPQIVWLRRDLRLADQPALACAATCGPVIPVYVLDDEAPGDHAIGGAARWWLHHSLESLADTLGRKGLKLVLRRGEAVSELCKLADEAGTRTIHAIRHYEPWWREAEVKLSDRLELCLHDGNYLMPPGSVVTGSGEPYKIYTPFMKSLMSRYDHQHPLAEPSFESSGEWPSSDRLSDWHLLPSKPDWAGGFREAWEAGEAAAHERFEWWVDQVADYEGARNFPSIDGSARISPHLHWGEISPRQVWDALDGQRGEGANTFRKELVWRDYAQTVICQFPDYATKSYRDGYDAGLWRRPESSSVVQSELEAWQQGRTGYPIVDAGMRQMWASGWMHNRVRMIAASFLIKHLLIDWRHGERWFWDCLVDSDYGSNAVNWQWIAGTGIDSNMFPRIMAPLSQSEKFDAGNYIREWVPELADLTDEHVHDPPDELRGAYPVKLIGHKQARERALAAYREAKRGA